MKIISYQKIIDLITEKYFEINIKLNQKVKRKIEQTYYEEKNPLAKKYLKVIIENIKIAEEEKIPICQDTGMAIVFVEIGAYVKIKFGKYNNLDEIINEGIKRASEKGFLRKSIVLPIERKNTGTNTPSVIHYLQREKDKFKITIMAKGFGSENTSRIKMLSPSDGKIGIEKFIIETLKKANGLPCPPVFVGIGIGGSFEKCAILSKLALTKIGEKTEYDKWEKEIIEKINRLNIGTLGLGGNITALDLKMLTFPTHIAGLPVAVNICCWAHRIGEIEL